MRVTCKHCGRAHPSYECKYRDTKSTAALMEVQTKAKGGSFVHKGEAQSNGSSVAQSGEHPPAGGRSGVQIPPTAGTQALPVDTNSPGMAIVSKSPRLGMDEVTGLEAARQAATPMTGKTNPERAGNTCGGGNNSVGLAHRLGRGSTDTNPESSMETLDSSIHETPFTPSAGTGEDKDRQPKPRGRPRIHPDRKAYKAEHERNRRAMKKESRNAE